MFNALTSLSAEFHFDPTVLPREAVDRCAHAFSRPLRVSPATPRHRSASGRSSAARSGWYVLVECNDTHEDVQDRRWVHERFEEWASRTPGATAVVCENRRLSYDQLNARSNQLAHRLQSIGVAREVRVALCIERSPELVVAVLATLKAGGVVRGAGHPALPLERLTFMLADSGAHALVTRRALGEPLRRRVAHAILLDEDSESLARERSDNPGNEVGADDLVYVMYTSGSTGRPERGSGRTRSGCELCSRRSSAGLDFPAAASFAMVSTFAADLGNTALFPALLSGGTLHVVAKSGEGAAAFDWRYLDEPDRLPEDRAVASRRAAVRARPRRGASAQAAGARRGRLPVGLVHRIRRAVTGDVVF